MRQREQFPAVPWQKERLPRLVCKNVSRKESTQYTNSGFKHLWFCIDIKLNPFNHLPYSILEAGSVIQDNQCVEDVYKGQREIPSYIVVDYILASGTLEGCRGG